MKNLSVTLIIGILLCKPGFTQSIQDSIIPKKNELSIDLIPAIKLLSDLTKNHMYDYKGTVQYKRRLNKNIFLRFGATVTLERSPKKYTNITSTYSDSLSVNYQQHQHKPELQLNTGIEYRWGKKRIKQFTGLDIGYIHTKTITSLYHELLPYYNMTYDPNTYDPDVKIGQSSSSSDPHSNAIIYSYSSTANGIAITPFYGVQYHFSSRFFFSMQLGFQLQLLQSVNKSIVSNPLYYNSNKTYEFNAGTGGILNNFSIAYRF